MVFLGAVGAGFGEVQNACGCPVPMVRASKNTVTAAKSQICGPWSYARKENEDTFSTMGARQVSSLLRTEYTHYVAFSDACTIEKGRYG